MSSRAVKLHLIIHDHLDNTMNQFRCLNAMFDGESGQLFYEEEHTHIQVRIDYVEDTFLFKRLGSDQTHIQLIHQNHSTFSVGAPALQGETWLESYRITHSNITLHYKLYLQDEVITDRTMVYTIQEADA